MSTTEQPERLDPAGKPRLQCSEHGFSADGGDSWHPWPPLGAEQPAPVDGPTEHKVSDAVRAAALGPETTKRREHRERIARLDAAIDRHAAMLNVAPERMARPRAPEEIRASALVVERLAAARAHLLTAGPS